MRNLKRILALTVVLVLVLGQVAFAAAPNVKFWGLWTTKASFANFKSVPVVLAITEPTAGAGNVEARAYDKLTKGTYTSTATSLNIEAQTNNTILQAGLNGNLLYKFYYTSKSKQKIKSMRLTSQSQYLPAGTSLYQSFVPVSPKVSGVSYSTKTKISTPLALTIKTNIAVTGLEIYTKSGATETLLATVNAASTYSKTYKKFTVTLPGATLTKTKNYVYFRPIYKMASGQLIKAGSSYRKTVYLKKG